MNDRFRFRAWDKQDKELIYEAENTYDCQSYNGHTIWHDNFACLLDDEERYTVEQCTGLKDKNGKLIYEGDIILSNMEYGGTHFVIVGDVRGYCYDAVAVVEYKQYLANGKETWGGLSSTAYHIITDHGPCEVVGNIHENPELLEDK